MIWQFDFTVSGEDVSQEKVQGLLNWILEYAKVMGMEVHGGHYQAPEIDDQPPTLDTMVTSTSSGAQDTLATTATPGEWEAIDVS